MKRKRNGTRSPNGFGTCYRLPGKRSRPWVARVTVGWTTVKKNGREVPRQIYKTIGYFAEKKDGLAALGISNQYIIKNGYYLGRTVRRMGIRQI